MFGFHFKAFRHELDHNGRAAHRQRASQGQRGLPIHAPHARHKHCQRQCNAGREENGEPDLRKPKPKNIASHGTKLGQIELQTNHKHQEYHPELAQVTNTISIFGQRQSIGPDDHTHRQITEHRWQFHGSKRHHPQNSRQQVK